MTESSEKAAYVAPELVELGSFEEMTQATFSGKSIDGNYTLTRGEPNPGVLS